MERPHTAEPVSPPATRRHPIRVLLAEDHETVREGLRLLLQAMPGVEIVGEAADAASAVDGVRREAPEVVVLDISMPGRSGLSAIPEMLATHPGTKIVVLTRHRDRAFAREAIAAGAMGYVLKQSPFHELHTAIRAAVAGERYVDRQVASEDAGWPPVMSGSLRVSEREWEVLKQTAMGASNKDVAAALRIAVKTVEVHKSNAMRKLGLRDRRELVRYAVARGWLREV
jgi:DNA-binding NarL/FixJ family response regulator